MANTANPEGRPLEDCLAALLHRFGLARAHFAGRNAADLQGLALTYPERMASLMLLCPQVLDTPTLATLQTRLLIVTGDQVSPA